MNMTPRSIVALLFVFTLLITACTPLQPAPPPGSSGAPTTVPETDNGNDGENGTENGTGTEGDAVDNLAGTQWVLESFGAPGAETAVVGEMPVTLEFSNDGQVSGNGGCNSYSGAYQIQEGTLMLGEVISTLMACVDTALMDQEILYLDALQTVSDFTIDGDHLTITYDEGQGALNFVRAEGTPEQEEIPATSTPAPEANAPTQDFL